MSAFLEHSTNEQIGHFGWNRPQCLEQLQAADLYAYENYLELLSQEKAFREGRAALKAPARENLKIICSGIEQDSVFFTVKNLHGFADQLDEQFKTSSANFSEGQ